MIPQIKRKFGLASRKGFGLIEVIIAIAISAAAAYYFLVMVPKAKESNQASKEVTYIGGLQSGIRSVFNGTPTYANLTSTVLINANVVPSSMISGANIINSWGATVTVGPASLGGVTNNAFSITYPNVTQGACVQIVTSIGQSSDVVTINGTSVKAYGANALDPAATATACAAGGASNTLIFQAI